MKRPNPFPFHPFLLALFPTLALLAANIKEVSPAIIWRPLAISLVLACLVYGLTRLVIRNTARAALFASILLLAFFSYGRVYDALRLSTLAATGLVRHRYLVILFVGLILAAFIWLLRSRRELPAFTRFLNILSILLVTLPTAQSALFLFRTSSGIQAASTGQADVSLFAPAEKPDVYFIILDSYTRADVLQQELGFDNSDFIHQLQDLGFYVAGCSRANYDKTQSSLVSSLNMDYIPDLYQQASALGISESDIWLLIQSNSVMRDFQSIGYQTVGFDTGYQWNSIPNVDLYLSRGKYGFNVEAVSPFEQLLMDSTVFSIYSDLLRQRSWDAYSGTINPYSNYIGRQEYILDQLPRIAEIPEATFTFAHIDVTHMPFVFSPQGYLTEQESMQFPSGYIAAIEYINPRMIAIIQQILASSKTPPIIILQGDHGYYRQINGGYARLSPILNAYYLPGIPNGVLSPTLSPVNNFRLVFNTYFQAKLPLLPNISYDYQDVTRIIPEEYGDCLP